MKRTKLLALTTLLALLATGPTVLAQEAPGTVGQVIVATPMAGHGAPFEKGVKDYMAWAKGAGAQWTWLGFEIVMGERTGQFVFGTFGHEYADWDTPDLAPAQSGPQVDRLIAPHVEDVVVSLVQLRPELSMLVPDAPVRPLYEVITLDVKPGGTAAMRHWLEKLKKAFEAAGAPAEYFVYQGAQGSSGDTWIVSIPHASFASMGGPGEDDWMQNMMESAYGEYEAREIMEMPADFIASSWSEVFAFRPDLSLNLPTS